MFNALTQMPMPNLRKKERWLDHVRQEPGEDRGALRRSPTTAFRWRHRFLRAPASDKPRSLRGIVEG
jgi:hypothetical protein